jgi:hypothetical protein
MPSDPVQAQFFSLHQLSLDTLLELDENELIPKREHESLVNRILRDLAIELRLQLSYSEYCKPELAKVLYMSMRNEIIFHTKNLINKQIQNIVKRAVKNGI